jgi:hypothetical protein
VPPDNPITDHQVICMNSVYAPVLLGASLAVYIVLLALLSTLVARVDSPGQQQSRHRERQQQWLQRERDMTGIAGAAILGTGTPTVLQQPAVANVIPLYWDAGVSEYIIRFTAGASTVTAAFDTGSSKLVLATAVGQSASGTYYDTTYGRPVSMQGVVGSSAPAGALQQCTFTQAYGTQTDTVAVFEDTVAFPRVQLQLCTLCTASTTRAVAGGSTTTALSIPNFPVNGIVNGGTTAGTPSVNVFGMSSVMTTTRAGAAYMLPSCQQVPEPQYEAALLQTLAAYYAAQPDKPDFCWSMMLGTPPSTALTPLTQSTQPAGFVVFGPLSVPCLRPQFTPAVTALPIATTLLTATPSRYYTVQVLSASIGPASAAGGAAAATAFVPLAGFPQFLLVDSGTTQVLLSSSAGPAQNAANISALNSIGADQIARITLVNNVVIEYTKPMVTWEDANGGTSPVFAAMDPAFAAELSSSLNVGILGSTGMRDLYVEFNLSRAQIGFAQVCTTCPCT